MSAPAIAQFSQDQWTASVPAEEARAAIARALELSHALATGELGDIDGNQAAYLIRVAVFNSASGAQPGADG